MSSFRVRLRLPALVLAASLAFPACAGPPAARLVPSNAHAAFDFRSGASFDEYVRTMRGALEDNWRGLHGDTFAAGTRLATPIEEVIAANAPSQTPPAPGCPPGTDGRYRRGVLVVHGLYFSPYVMHDLAEVFAQRCFLARSLLLPGHGTRPGDLREITVEDWEAAVAWGVRSLGTVADEVYVAGYSTGGTLAIGAALDDAGVDGLFLFAPALEIGVGAVGYLAPVLAWLDWVPMQVFDDDDFAKYETLAMNSAVQIVRLSDAVHARLQTDAVPVPIFLALSLNDYTVDAIATLRLLDAGRLGADARTVVLGAGCRGDGVDACRAYLEGGGRDTGSKRFVPLPDDPRIAGYSHMSLTLRPDDPHYGYVHESLEGVYLYCLHYFLPFQDDERRRCENPATRAVVWGERDTERPEGAVLRLLPVNPRFDVVVEEIDAFVEECIERRTC